MRFPIRDGGCRSQGRIDREMGGPVSSEKDLGRVLRVSAGSLAVDIWRVTNGYELAGPECWKLLLRKVLR